MVNPPWVIMSQASTEEGPLPTTLVFEPNAYIQFLGPPKEEGRLMEQWSASHQTMTLSYSTAAHFVQRVHLPHSVMTLKVAGTVFYTACKDDVCLPSEQFKFKVDI